MKRAWIFGAWFSVAVLAFAGERVTLWPEGKIPNFQPQQIAATTQEVKEPGFKPAERVMPYLDWYDPPVEKNGACMLLISGGGYQNCCDGVWIDRVAKKLLDLGFVCVSLTYRTPRPQGLPIYQSGWQDGQRAVRLVRSEAQKRGFDPEKIGAFGFSAGSHLTVLLATSALTPAYEAVDALDQLPCHVNWAIPIYTAYALTDGLTGPNTRDGDAIDVKLTDVFKFDAKTCPMVLFHGGTDVYSPNGSTQIYRQLRRMKIPAEIHLFADRPHGFMGDPSKGEQGTAYDNWLDRIAEYLRQMNFDGRLGEEVDLMARYPNDDARDGYRKEPVWPEGRIPDLQTNQCVPYLEWHMPKTRTTKAIQIIYSGGSYMGNSPDGFEVAPTRRFLNEKGMTVVTMKYRTPRPLGGLAKHTTAWQDLQRAVRVVRSQAAALGLDPDRIGIMGSSAGGHLTLMGATSSKRRAYWPIDDLDKLSCSVQWAIAIYPAYALTDGAEKPNTQGGNEDDSRLVPEFSFDLATCPILFIHGDADGWAAMNSIKCWEQLRRMGIQGDLHTLVGRPHCFQRKAAPGTGSYTWMGRIWEFMNHKGFNK
ncbi:MAG: alpha/beta hydrolase [Kiritimatiellae bacterium]|jgi:acetyl esterase/lipase|nr:alpha/beta hydrolase [Kiritimatiellia bacterium]MDD2349007.1 alpha/beta hydrolase [Kiritimatiellia bacterium]MDD3584356.1 alpha/beta hydrolase [Kiritimatiellia bacterium]HHU16206.1 alpha/beta hydrolase [Lentisphaerota bacterium]HON46983.1 alpha/beta hydrolase [Kiritimatiellia bacterium]